MEVGEEREEKRDLGVEVFVVVVRREGVLQKRQTNQRTDTSQLKLHLPGKASDARVRTWNAREKEGRRVEAQTHRSVANDGHGESEVRSRSSEESLEEELNNNIGVEEERVELVAEGVKRREEGRRKEKGQL